MRGRRESNAEINLYFPLLFMMKRFACHRLYVSADGCYSKYVVELKEDGRVNVYFPLKEEISATEWIGGGIVLSPYPELELEPGENFASFLKRAITETEKELYAWHISDFDFIKNELMPAGRVIRL